MIVAVQIVINSRVVSYVMLYSKKVLPPPDSMDLSSVHGSRGDVAIVSECVSVRERERMRACVCACVANEQSGC